MTGWKGQLDICEGSHKLLCDVSGWKCLVAQCRSDFLKGFLLGFGRHLSRLLAAGDFALQSRAKTPCPKSGRRGFGRLPEVPKNRISVGMEGGLKKGGGVMVVSAVPISVRNLGMLYESDDQKSVPDLGKEARMKPYGRWAVVSTWQGA